MERFILSYEISDGCTYSFTETVPILYESAEQLIIDFEELCTKKNAKAFRICGHEFEPYVMFENGKYYGPRIYTVDEWFAQVEK